MTMSYTLLDILPINAIYVLLFSDKTIQKENNIEKRIFELGIGK